MAKAPAHYSGDRLGHATANRWDVTEELEVLAAQGTHHRTPDVVAYVNGIPLVVIEAKRPESGGGSHPAKAMVTEGISQHLRNQRPDEIPNLFAYAQLLLSISQTEGRYGTTHTAAKFWAVAGRGVRRGPHAGAQNKALKLDVRAALFEASLPRWRRTSTLWSAPMQTPSRTACW